MAEGGALGGHLALDGRAQRMCDPPVGFQTCAGGGTALHHVCVWWRIKLVSYLECKQTVCFLGHVQVWKYKERPESCVELNCPWI